MNNQGTGTSGGDKNDVKVPREVNRGNPVGRLVFVKRKPWKYRTQQDFEQSLEDYDIKIPSGKCSRSCSNLDSLITLEVASAECGSKERPVDKIVIRKEYAWDGASGPTFDTRASFEASLVHDALYQCMRLGYVTPGSRKEVDRLFLDMLADTGTGTGTGVSMGMVRRSFWYSGVRVFGRKASTRKPYKRRTFPGIIATSIGGLWLLYWMGSNCFPAQTAAVLDCLRGLLERIWIHCPVGPLESGLGLLGLWTLVCIGTRLIGRTCRRAGENAIGSAWRGLGTGLIGRTCRRWGRKQKGGERPVIVAWIVISVGAVLAFWMCWPVQFLAALGALTLVLIGIELCIGDSCSLKVCKCPTACENDSQETSN